jgi:hypothetical protein
MILELVVMPFFPLKHEALCEAQARLTIKQVVEMFDKVHLKPSGEANLALEYAAIVAGLREMVK